MQKFDDNFDKIYKIVVVGEQSVGKTTIIKYFCQKKFVTLYYPTLAVEFNIAEIMHKNQPIKLQIWEKPGKDIDFSDRTQTCFKSAHAVIFVFDIADKKSLHYLQAIKEKVDEFAKPHVYKLIVGNKADLNEKRQIRWEEGFSLGTTWGADYIETSAISGVSIKELFNKTVQGIERNEGCKIETYSSVSLCKKNGGLCSTNCA